MFVKSWGFFIQGHVEFQVTDDKLINIKQSVPQRHAV